MNMSEFNFNEILNAEFIQNVLKPFVITVGTVFSAKACLFLGNQVTKGVSFSVNQALEDYDLVEKYGEYVVINNASDPIGMEFAKAFAEKGHSLMLIGGEASSFETQMREVTAALHKGRTVTLIKKDRDQTDDATYKSIKEQILKSEACKNIGIFFNNGGSPMSVDLNDDPTFLSEPPMVINFESHRLVADYLRVTHDIFHIMVENKKGLIVNMSHPTFCNNLHTVMPLDLREFVENMNSAIRQELDKKKYRDVHIKVEALHPGTICIWNQYKRCCPSKLNPKASVYAKSAINIMGKARSSAGYGYHGFEQFMSAIVPNMITRLVTETVKSIDRRCKPSKEGYDMIPGNRSVATSAGDRNDDKDAVIKFEEH